MKQTKLCVAIAGLFLLTGCAFSPVKKPAVSRYAAAISNVEAFNSSRDTTLRAVKDAAAQLGYMIGDVNEASGFLQTRPLQVITPRTCDCGTWNGADVAGTADSVLEIRLTSEGTKTLVRLAHTCSTTFTGRNLYGIATRTEKVDCASVGDAEKRFWSATRDALAGVTDVQAPSRRYVVAPHSSAAAPLLQPPYPPESRKKGQQGIAGMRVYVLEDGTVADAKVEVSTGYSLLDEEAVKTAKTRWKLIPGTIDGRPAAMWGTFAVTFSLYTRDIPRDQSAELKAQRDAYQKYLDELERAAAATTK